MSRENPFSLQPNNARLYAKYDSNIPKYKNIIDEKFPHKENDKDSSNDNKTCILPKSSSLLRLFNSEMFSVSMAIHYLFSSKEQGVIMYLGNKLFQFDPDETLFYMPQLLSLSFMSSDVALSVYTYVIVRSQECAQSHLTCIVILNSFTNRHQKMHHKAIILKKKLITLDVSEFKYFKNSNCLFDPEYKKSHQRSQSDFSIPNSFTDLSKVPLNTHTPQKNVKTVNSNCYYFDESCTCNVGQIRDLKSRKSEAISAYNYNKKIPIDQCVCPGLLIRPQIRFINAIIDIGNRLQTIQSPHLRTSYLINELNKINKALPARVWVPFDHLNPHHIVNVPPLSSSLLKSSDNAPFLIYIEVVECDNLLKSPLPQIANNPMRMVQSVDNVNTLSDASSVPSLYDQKPADTLSKHSFKPDYRSHTRHVSINNTIISSSLALDSLSLTSYDSYLSTDNNEINGGSIVGSSLNSNYFSPSRVRDNLLVNVGQKVNLSQISRIQIMLSSTLLIFIILCLTAEKTAINENSYYY
ncbi:hypothetical protein A3Q56_00584 [Intoshia linei]|uniref:PI4KB/PIK1 accessory domain-containing protein n=1 Tax=Intoshia linei TaxID=1819745 RepID=A0A177BBN0_9BILA|nr:hypothetical protein A3Q56_00584 [Intoshia linei]